MKLICEVNEQDVQYITEANENGQKDYKIKGILRFHRNVLRDQMPLKFIVNSIKTNKKE